MTVLWGIIIFAVGALFGMMVMGVIAGANNADQRIWELRHLMILRMEQWLRNYNDHHSSAYDRMVAKEATNAAISVIRNTEAD